jgi:hypothetical protein
MPGYLITIRKLVTHTVTIRVEAIDRMNAEAKALGFTERNPTHWDSVVEGSGWVESVREEAPNE